MYYTYQGKTYRHAAVFVGNTEIELTARTTSTVAKIFIIILSIATLGLAWVFWWYLFKGGQISSHFIQLSDKIKINKIDERTVSIISDDKKHDFILFLLEPEDVEKLISPKIFKPKKALILNNEPVQFENQSNEKYVYVKVATRNDVPQNADTDPETGAKIVYIIEDEN